MTGSRDGGDDGAGDGSDPRAYELAACGLLTTAPDGQIVRANATLAGWLGHPPEALLGRRFQDLLTVGSKLFHQTHWMPLLQMQGSVAEVQLEMVHRDGAVLPVLVNARLRDGVPAPRAPRGPVDIAVFVAADRRKYERELLLARRRAEELLEREREAQEALARTAAERQRAEEELRREAQQRAVLAEQLIGIVSHDLRNPLNAIVLGARLLATAPLGPHARTVDRITSAAGRANRLIADLLDFTQARLGGGLRVERKEADVHQVVGDAVEEVRLAWSGRAVIHRRVGEGLAAFDPDRVAQIVTNLTGNALTYGAPGDPVTITTVVGPGAVEVHVHNTGAPIPVELQAHIFEPMRRGEGELRKGHRSVGLGLYIVREIAGAHGGAVTVRSTAEEGTTFAVTLPRDRALERAPGDEGSC